MDDRDHQIVTFDDEKVDEEETENVASINMIEEDAKVTETDPSLRATRGQKRRFDNEDGGEEDRTEGDNQNEDDNSNNHEAQSFVDAATITRDLPLGVSITWNNKSDLIATITYDAMDECHIKALGDDVPLRLCLVGRAKVECVEGQALILGYKLIPGSPAVSFSSPFWSSWTTIECNRKDSDRTKLLISSIRGTPSFRLTTPSRPTIIPSSWKSSVDKICSDFHAAPAPVRESLEEDSAFMHADDQLVMICGSKGVGKSTLLRYLTNRLLQSCSKETVPPIAILDADVGQPEFAPPGMLRLSLQREPLLQPPYRNLCAISQETIEHIGGIYYGATTSKVDPTRYIESVQELVSSYRMLLQRSPIHIPLIVNLDGWIKGMGFQILSALISGIRPSHICQLLGEANAKAFDISGIVSGLQNTYNNPCELFFLDVCSKHVSPFTIPSSSLRTLRLGAYFGPHLLDLWDSLDFLPAKNLQTGWNDDDECTLARHLAQERPYCVSFEAVKCVHSSSSITSFCKEEADEAHAFKILNGSIVGLSKDVEGGCIGLGIIRSIDWNRRVFFILTPVPANRLVDVTVLIAGNIPLPVSLVFRGVYAESFPYLYSTENSITQTTTNESSQGYQILGSEPMKSRNNIGRRSFTMTTGTK